MSSFKLRKAEREPTPGRWVVHKFGGTSVGSAQTMQECIDIIKPISEKNRVAMVVSAMGGKPKTTDLLLDMVHAAAASQYDDINEKMDFIRVKHRNCVDQLLSKTTGEGESIMQIIEKDLRDILDLLRAVQLMHTAHDQILELVSGYGEIWSAMIIAAALQEQGLPFKFLNARDVLLVNEATKVFWDESSEKLQTFLKASEDEFAGNAVPSDGHSCEHELKHPHLIITGYIASLLNGTATTLKRDGSDYSASIFGRLLNAESITIWTDVSGVYSADPRRVPKAQILPDVSYKEAIELAYFGAKVIHPKTMEPAISENIPIFIRNTFKPQHPGTRIYASPAHLTSTSKIREKTVCGFTTVDNIALVNIEGTGMIGVPGVAHRVFGALHAANVPVMFIAQASSEHNICFAINHSYVEQVQVSIEEAFFYELKNGSLSKITIIEDCTIVAAVGESMSNMAGVSGLFFGALGDAAVNVVSISQGCDERTIAAVVKSEDATRALRAVHAAFWFSSVDVSIGIVGTGRVGSALLLNLLNQVELLGNRLGLNIKIRGVCNSRKMWLGDNLNGQLMDVMSYFNPNPNPIMRKRSDSKKDSKTSFHEIQECMQSEGENREDTDLHKFIQHIKGGPTPHNIIIDTSSSHDVARMHPFILRSRAHVVTANKRAIAGSLDLYNAVFEEMRASHQSYMSEVTIGASLPIRTTLSDILCSGDAVYAIVGIMSVSVNMILTAVFEEGVTFTTALQRTYDQGLFEENAFADLEGFDAGEKVLIMGRELGIPMHMNDISISPLAPERDVPDWSNIQGLFDEEDAYIAERVEKARANNCTLRYVQRIECDPPAELGGRYGAISVKASVKLEEVPMDSILAMARGAVYNFCFHTDRYSQSPLIVQGPLSDPANTASGIVGDIMRIARSVGAKDRGPDALDDITNPTTSNQQRLSGNQGFST